MFYYIEPVTTKIRTRPWYEFSKKGNFEYTKINLPINHKRVRYELLEMGVKYLTPIGFRLPRGYKRYGGDEWKIKLNFLKLSRTLSAKGGNVVIFDSNGEYIESAETLIKKAKRSAVFTERDDLYGMLSDRLMEQYGIPLQINTASGIASAFLFSPKGSKNIEGTELVTVKLSETEIDLPKELSLEIFPKVSPYALLEALFENGNMLALDKLT